MTKQEFDEAIADLQDIQKRVPWDDPRKKEAHDTIRSLVLTCRGEDIGPFDL